MYRIEIQLLLNNYDFCRVIFVIETYNFFGKIISEHLSLWESINIYLLNDPISKHALNVFLFETVVWFSGKSLKKFIIL